MADIPDFVAAAVALVAFETRYIDAPKSDVYLTERSEILMLMAGETPDWENMVRALAVFAACAVRMAIHLPGRSPEDIVAATGVEIARLFHERG